MVEQFTKLRGCDPVPFMLALTGTIIGSREQSDKFLYDYRRTLADLMASEHYGTVADVAHKQGLIVYGEVLENGRPSIGDDMAMRRYADVRDVDSLQSRRPAAKPYRLYARRSFGRAYLWAKSGSGGIDDLRADALGTPVS